MSPAAITALASAASSTPTPSRGTHRQASLCTCAGSDGDFLHVAQGRVSLMHLVMYGLLEPRKRGMHGGAGLPQVVHRVALFDNTGKLG